MSASTGDILFFLVAFGVVRYERRNLFSTSSVVPSLFSLSRTRLKVSTNRSA